MNTSELIEVWRGVQIRTVRRSMVGNVAAAMGQLVGADPKRISIAIQNNSGSPVSLQHSFDTGGELPVTIPANGLYTEDFESDSDQVTTAFFASTAGAGVTVNVIELILE